MTRLALRTSAFAITLLGTLSCDANLSQLPPELDGGQTDAGQQQGPPDAGQDDAGEVDAGAVDGGERDAGVDAGPGSDCVDGPPGGYAGQRINSQTSAFEMVFDVTPSVANLGAGLALATGTQLGLAWTDLAVIVRFDVDGTIDVRSGAAYQSLLTMPYSPGVTYRVRAEVDVPNRQYSVFVTAPGGSEQALARGYSFRAVTQPVVSLDQWGTISDTGSLRVCLISTRPLPITPPTDAGMPSDGGAGDDGGAGACNAAYPFEGYTSTRGAFEALEDGQPNPRVLIVDRLTSSSSDGNETTGRGSLPWALSRTYPRVVLFETSGTINVGGSLAVSSPYVSVHGQSAPSPGITLYNVEFLIRTHDVIVQHLRIRMGSTDIGGGDAVSICGSGSATHDIIVDHCSAQLAHDEQMSISGCGAGAVTGVTLSNNIISQGLTTHNYGTLIDSGDNNNYGVDQVLLNGNLWSQVSYRTPLINPATRHITVTNNVAYNQDWNGLQLSTMQYTQGMYVDYMHNLYWRGPRTQDTGTWPTNEVSTWPSQPSLWPWSANREATALLKANPGSGSGTFTHVYYLNNYQYVNGTDYTSGNHEGRPVILDNERFTNLTASDIERTSRVTSVTVALKTPLQVEQALSSVGAAKFRDAVDALAVNQALARNGDWLLVESDLGVAPYPTGSTTRTLGSVPCYPTGHELSDSDADGNTDLEEWIYGL